MIQRGQNLRFAFESRQTLRVLRQPIRQGFDRHVPAEFGIAAAVDFAHTARSDAVQDFNRTKLCSTRQRHDVASNYFNEFNSTMIRAGVGRFKFGPRAPLAPAAIWMRKRPESV